MLSKAFQSPAFSDLYRVVFIISYASFLLAVPCRGQVPLISAGAYPQSSYYLPVANRASLQWALDTYQDVRLDANANYVQGGVSQLTIGSGEKLYGLPGTAVPPVIVTPGTQQAVLSCLQTDSVTFPPSAVITHDNLFLSIKGSAIAHGATLNDNLIVDWMGGLSLDDSTSGHFKDNRFIRSLAHNASNPYLRLRGNSQDASFGNVFLFYNFLTPPGDGADISGQTDVTFVGVDGESWNWFGWGTNALITTAADVGTLRFFVANGADFIHTAGSPAATGYFNIGAENFLLYNDISSSASANKTELQTTVGNAIMWNVPAPNQPGQGLKIDGASTFDYSFTGAVTAAQLHSARVSSLQSALTPLTGGRPEVPWEAPLYDPVPDPGGADWNQNLPSKPDSSVYIQNLINTQGIAFLPAGTYYISHPLRLNSTQGLIGAGMGSTLIIATDPTIDMIVGDDHVAVDTITSMALGDLTLQGGLNGIHHAPSGSGAGAQYNLMFLSHVSFRNMSNAGIFIDSIVAWDNNLIDHVNFVNCGTGIKQRVSPTYAGGEAPGQSYLDKNVFYHCQFISNGVALDLPAERANNLNVWVENLFDNNQNGVSQMTNNLSAVIANSDFINNGGAAVLTNDGSNLSIVSCRFTAGLQGNAMFSGTFSVEGSSFQEGAGGRASMVLNGGILSFFNSYSVNMPTGPILNGYFFNNQLYENPALSVQGVSVQNGKKVVILPGGTTGNPAPTLLLGAPLQIRY
jgi:hypothetical protein